MKKIIRYFGNRGLVWKITLTMALILVIPIGIIGFFYYSVFQNSLLRDAQIKLTESLNVMQDQMNNNLDSISAVMNELDYRQELSYFLDERNDLSERERQYYISNVQKEMVDIRYLYPNRFYSISIYSSNTQVIDHDWQVDFQVLAGKNYFHEIEDLPDGLHYGAVRESEFITSSLDVDNLNIENGDTWVLPAYLKVFNLSTKEFIGLVEIDMEISKLVEQDNLSVQNSDVEYLLFDTAGKLVYSSGDFHSDDFAGIDFNEIGSRDIVIGKETYMMTTSRCERTGLVRAAMLSKKDVLSFASSMIAKVSALAMIGIISVVFIIHIIIKKMLNRLLVLNAMMGEIETGKFDVAIDSVGSNDEISRIEKKFNQMASHLDAIMSATVEKEKAQREAELRALQAQINPHFLYNTLENMRMQCEIDGYLSLGDSLAALGDLFRYSIKWGSNEVPFALEWKNLQNYIAIMKMRFEDDVKCIMECEEGLEDIIVPKLILQPLVENSFDHGFKEVLPPWLILIRAFKKDGRLIIIIEDDGKGIEAGRLAEIRSCMEEAKPLSSTKKERNSIGIINVRQRIDMICRPGSFIRIDSQKGSGTKLYIEIVCKEEPDV